MKIQGLDLSKLDQNIENQIQIQVENEDTDEPGLNPFLLNSNNER